MEKIVSVIMPTYNRAEIISRAIESVLNQKYARFELIIIDDGSTDDTELVVRKYDDSRIIYYSCESNRGANHARNIGLHLSSGEYISFLDSDNIWDSDFLSKHIELINKYRADISFCRVKIHESGKVDVYPNISNTIFKIEGLIDLDNLRLSMLKSNQIDTNTVCIKRKCIKGGEFNEKLMRLQDWDFFCRIIFSQQHRIVYTPDILVNGFLQKNSIRFMHDYLEGFLYIFEYWMHLYEKYGLVEAQCEKIIRLSIQRKYGGVRRDVLVGLLRFLPECVIQEAIVHLKLKSTYELNELKSMRQRAIGVGGWKTITKAIGNRCVFLYTDSLTEMDDLYNTNMNEILEQIDYIICDNENVGIMYRGIPVVGLNIMLENADNFLCLVLGTYEKKNTVLKRMNLIENVDYIDANYLVRKCI